MTSQTSPAHNEISKDMLGRTEAFPELALRKAVSETLASALITGPLREIVATTLTDATLSSMAALTKSQLGVFVSPTFARGIAPTLDLAKLTPELNAAVASIVRMQTIPKIDVAKLISFPAPTACAVVASETSPKGDVPAVSIPDEADVVEWLRGLPPAEQRKLTLLLGGAAAATLSLTGWMFQERSLLLAALFVGLTTAYCAVYFFVQTERERRSDDL